RARLPVWVRPTLKATVPGPRPVRTSRPTRTFAAPDAATDARLASRSTSRRAPVPAEATVTEPRTNAPRWLWASFRDCSEGPASGDGCWEVPGGGALGPMAVGVGVEVVVVVPFGPTVTVPLISLGCTVHLNVSVPAWAKVHPPLQFV